MDKFSELRRLTPRQIAVYRDRVAISDSDYELIPVHTGDLRAMLAELEASKKSNAFLKEQLAKLANFNPDWDMLEACRESWREVAAALKEAEAKLATPVRLPNKSDDEFWFDGVFQVAKFDRAVERAIRAAGFTVEGDE